MTEHEQKWDSRLNIRTSGRDDTISDEYRYPYEPTPYCVLERLAQSGMITQGDTVLDYGCGKGRVGFFLSAQTGARTIGIEYDDRIYADAVQNRKAAKCKEAADFVAARAEEYEVPASVTACYFFNPFSVEILHKVIARIMESYYREMREVRLFFYYPSDEYMCYLMTLDELEFYDEIDCDDLFEGNDPRERIMVFRLC